jgi:hypothetical protein
MLMGSPPPPPTSIVAAAVCEVLILDLFSDASLV